MLMAAHLTPASGPALANLDCEAALLGAIMIENRVYDDVESIVRADDFADPVHQRIFEAIGQEIAAGRRASPVTLEPRFADDPGIVAFGGPGYLRSLTGSAAGLFGFKEFASQIADLAARRRLTETLGRIVQDAGVTSEDGYRPLAEIVDEADAAIVAAVERRDSITHDTIGQSIDRAIARMEEIRANAGRVGARTGIDELDELLGGFEPGQVVIVAGRPGMGKTAVACSAALGLARNGHGVGVFSLEMRSEELGMRMVADLCCWRRGQWIPFDVIRDGTATEEQFAVMRRAREHVAKWPLDVIDFPSATVARLALSIRRTKRKMAARGQKLEVAIVDYLQLLHPDSRTRSAYEAVSEISRALKAMAKELGVAIVALAQLSRAVEQRDDKRPQLSDLRDSGQIEQDADAVVFLYRDEYYLAREKPKKGQEDDHQARLDAARGQISFICAKRRNGPTGTANAVYLPIYQAVRSASWRVS